MASHIFSITNQKQLFFVLPGILVGRCAQRGGEPCGACFREDQGPGARRLLVGSRYDNLVQGSKGDRRLWSWGPGESEVSSWSWSSGEALGLGGFREGRNAAS